MDREIEGEEREGEIKSGGGEKRKQITDKVERSTLSVIN